MFEILYFKTVNKFKKLTKRQFVHHQKFFKESDFIK